VGFPKESPFGASLGLKVLWADIFRIINLEKKSLVKLYHSEKCRVKLYFIFLKNLLLGTHETAG
jgi:hypothetical protein